MCLAVPGRIVSIEGDDPAFRTGRVDFSGIVKRVNLACTPEAAIDDYVLVHAGFAISVVDADEAARIFDYIRQIGEVDDLTETESP